MLIIKINREDVNYRILADLTPSPCARIKPVLEKNENIIYAIDDFTYQTIRDETWKTPEGYKKFNSWTTTLDSYSNCEMKSPEFNLSLDDENESNKILKTIEGLGLNKKIVLPNFLPFEDFLKLKINSECTLNYREYLMLLEMNLMHSKNKIDFFKRYKKNAELKFELQIYEHIEHEVIAIKQHLPEPILEYILTSAGNFVPKRFLIQYLLEKLPQTFSENTITELFNLTYDALITLLVNDCSWRQLCGLPPHSSATGDILIEFLQHTIRNLSMQKTKFDPELITIEFDNFCKKSSLACQNYLTREDLIIDQIDSLAQYISLPEIEKYNIYKTHAMLNCAIVLVDNLKGGKEFIIGITDCLVKDKFLHATAKIIYERLRALINLRKKMKAIQTNFETINKDIYTTALHFKFIYGPKEYPYFWDFLRADNNILDQIESLMPDGLVSYQKEDAQTISIGTSIKLIQYGENCHSRLMSYTDENDNSTYKKVFVMPSEMNVLLYLIKDHLRYQLQNFNWDFYHSAVRCNLLIRDYGRKRLGTRNLCYGYVHDFISFLNNEVLGSHSEILVSGSQFANPIPPLTVDKLIAYIISELETEIFNSKQIHRSQQINILQNTSLYYQQLSKKYTFDYPSTQSGKKFKKDVFGPRMKQKIYGEEYEKHSYSFEMHTALNFFSGSGAQNKRRHDNNINQQPVNIKRMRLSPTDET